MNTLPAPRAPVHIVRWFTRPVLPCPQYPSGLGGCLVIHRNGVDDAMYDVVANCNWHDPQKPHEPLLIRGWRLLGRKRGAKVYDVCFQEGNEGCNCPHGTYRPEHLCKHWHAAKQGLEAIGLPLYGIVRNACPSQDELHAIFRQLPPDWFARGEKRPDGTWTIQATYHWDPSIRAEAETAEELLPLVQKAEAERLADKAPAPPPAPEMIPYPPPPPPRMRFTPRRPKYKGW